MLSNQHDRRASERNRGAEPFDEHLWLGVVLALSELRPDSRPRDQSGGEPRRTAQESAEDRADQKTFGGSDLRYVEALADIDVVALQRAAGQPLAPPVGRYEPHP